MGSALSSTEYSPVFHTKSGPIRGKILNSDDRKYYAFLGIPYAQPPIGELRFKKPQKALTWSEVRNCLKFGQRCPQKKVILEGCFRDVATSEANCLTLNLFSPKDACDSTKRLPVIMFIHGGGFAVHSSSVYGDTNIVRNLCSKGVVFVTINYRLGVFGFFTSGDSECPGNMGLWDQTMALSWVKDNIDHLGGDPNNIAVFGHSAGAESADLLSLSPHSRDLFHRVIAMSGSSICPGAASRKEGMAMNSRNFAREIGWKGKDGDTKGLMEFMTSQPYKKLISKKLVPSVKKSGKLTSPFLPNIDGDFFPTDIVTMRSNAPKKDYLMGTTACEGLMLNFVSNFPSTEDGMRNHIRYFFHGMDIGKELEDSIIKFYFEGVDPNDMREMKLRHAQFTGDYVVCNGVILNAIELTFLGHNVFLYNFEFFSPKNLGVFNYVLPFIAATHTFEIRYALGKGVINKFKPNEEDLKILDQMTTWITDFAKYGDPNELGKQAAWEKYNAKTPYRHFNINYPLSEMKEDYQGKRLRFWIEFRKKLDPILLKHQNAEDQLRSETTDSK